MTSIALVAAVGAMVLVAGCSGIESPVAGRESSVAASAAAVVAMPIEIRNVQLPKGFPVEIPVPDGRIERVDAQSSGGQEAWVYDLTVRANVDSVAKWYAGAYASANWTLEDERPGAQKGSVVLVFRKGGAESSIVLAPVDRSATRARASIGLGVPVTGTY